MRSKDNEAAHYALFNIKNCANT